MKRSPFTLRALALATLLCSGAPAFGQGFNLDIGNPAFGTPSSLYAGAAGQAGFWQPVAAPHSTSLVGLDAAPTTVSVNVTGGLGDLHFNNALTLGDDGELLDDFQDLGNANAPTTYAFTGLADGPYDVYTYAFAPDSPNYRTSVMVVGSPEPVQTVGGAWTGTHLSGTSYAMHSVQVIGGQLVVELTDVFGYGSLNGIQIVPDSPPPPVEPGTNYCFATQNSTGATAWMSATGSSSVSANDLVLIANDVPLDPGTGIFISGPGSGVLPMFNGFLCINPSGLQRISQITPPNASGQVIQAIDYTGATTGTVPLNVIAGQNFYFQHWFRDPNAGGGSANFTDGYVISFTP